MEAELRAQQRQKRPKNERRNTRTEQSRDRRSERDRRFPREKTNRRHKGKRLGRQMKECQRQDLAGAAAAALQWERANLKTPRRGDSRGNKRKADEVHPEDPERSDVIRSAQEESGS